MANIAQVVNVLQAVLMTEGSALVRTPTYHAFALHRVHLGAEALQVEVAVAGAPSGATPRLTATASADGDGTAVTLINRDYRESAVVTIVVPGRIRSGTVLAADSPDATNTPAVPDRVSPRNLAVEEQGHGSFRTCFLRTTWQPSNSQHVEQN
jgi:alpha-N-arabinofuranosidase